MSANRLRFGLLCSGYSWPRSSYEIVQSLQSLPGVSLELIVINQTPPQTTSRWSKLRKVITGQGLLWGLRSRLITAAPTEESVDLTEAWKQLPSLKIVAKQRGKYTQIISDQDIETIRSYNLDFLLKFSFGILRGAILHSTRYGIWSFHHGEPERYRGTPPGFWEVHDQHYVTGAILQRLTEKLDGGIVLQRCYSLTELTSQRKNYARIQQAAAHLPRSACLQLLAGDTTAVVSSPIATNAPIKRSPSDLQYLQYWLRSRYRRWGNRLKYLLTDEQWAVGLVKDPIQSFLNPDFKPQVEWIEASGAGKFLADPFAVIEGNKVSVVAEEYDYSRNYGKLVSFDLDSNGQPATPKIALDSGSHLSYPCTVTDGSNWYLLPESVADKRNIIYQMDEQGRWQTFADTKITEPLIDPTLFYYQNTWWILATPVSEPFGTLVAWYADKLVGPWLPHARNPLRTDPRNGRSAGTPFVHQDSLYRPAQNNTRTYGGSIVIHRIDRLTTSDFSETAIVEIKPDNNWPYPHGMHTLSSAGNWTLIDAKRTRWMPGRIPGKLWRRLR